MQQLLKDKRKLAKLSFFTGAALFNIGMVVIFLVFYPVISIELGYLVNPPEENTPVFLYDPVESHKEGVILAEDKEFGLIVPKIGANASVTSDVDPFNVNEYKSVLENSIAHAKTSAHPGEGKNTFLFAHSAVEFYEANRHNVRFYLLNKMEVGDKVYVSYKNKLYEYEVVDSKIIDPNEVRYLYESDYEGETLTLMTCSPAGMAIDRLIVTAKLVSVSD